MNKLLKIIISILAGISTVFEILTPILLAILFISLSGINTLSWIIFICGGLAGIFRAIKIWLRE